LLSCLVDLPVTKSTVKTSGLGKAINLIEKHKLCKGAPNESVITTRVQEIKDAWHAAVKALKATEATSSAPDMIALKREAESSVKNPSPLKRIKTGGDSNKSSAFASLLKMVGGPADQSANKDQDASEASNEALLDSKKGRFVYLLSYYHSSFYSDTTYSREHKEIFKARKVVGPFWWKFDCVASCGRGGGHRRSSR
jgi:hypothetical protein